MLFFNRFLWQVVYTFLLLLPCNIYKTCFADWLTSLWYFPEISTLVYFFELEIDSAVFENVTTLVSELSARDVSDVIVSNASTTTSIQNNTILKKVTTSHRFGIIRFWVFLSKLSYSHCLIVWQLIYWMWCFLQVVYILELL